MRLLLLRHGQTQANVEMRLSGWTDDPLDEQGNRQARAIASQLATEGPVSAVYASPLSRARTTAEYAARALGVAEVVERPGLRERHFGIFESLPLPTIMEQYPDFAASWAAAGATDWGPPEGEMPRQFVGRIMDELNGIIERHSGDERVLVVTHGGVISAALAVWFARDPARWREYLVNNCSVTEVEFCSAPRLVRFNECVELEW